MINSVKIFANAQRRLEIIAELGFEITPEMILREEKLDADYELKVNTVVSQNGEGNDKQPDSNAAGL